ncbi:MAG: hypothetical protein JJU29_10765 [Verrucomicrobia bacterium]|nr:hypothetical protein [Verrucomicrobiota bacterium]MCH8511936.1 hypothetical protein [Kiritimatiellia bacterium]
MKLKGQDVLLVLKLLSDGGRKGTFAALAEALGISASEAHAALGRAREAGLVHPLEDRAIKASVAEFLLHAIKYAFPVKPGGATRGMPTGFAAPPLNHNFRSEVREGFIWVWPDPEGNQGGLEIKPLCRSVPAAARRDASLYEWLVLADVLRGAGRARERELAASVVKERLGGHADS